VVRGEIPDYSVVVGVPGRVVRRHDGTAWRRTGSGKQSALAWPSQLGNSRG